MPNKIHNLMYFSTFGTDILVRIQVENFIPMSGTRSAGGTDTKSLFAYSSTTFSNVFFFHDQK